ncbi:hypothetical protein Tco_1117216 [Tanacetum coccineum]
MEDLQEKPVDPKPYRGMIGSLMYLTSSRPDLVFTVCMYARYQGKPTEKPLHAFTPGCQDIGRSTSGKCTILGGYNLSVWLIQKAKRALTISSIEVLNILLCLGVVAQFLMDEITTHRLRP